MVLRSDSAPEAVVAQVEPAVTTTNIVDRVGTIKSDMAGE